MIELKPGDAARPKPNGDVGEAKPGDAARPKSGADRSGVKPGDVVRLKSGGPWMTVNSFPDNEHKVQCRWFGKGVNEDRTLFEFFVVDTLEPEGGARPAATAAAPATPAAAAAPAPAAPAAPSKPPA